MFSQSNCTIVAQILDRVFNTGEHVCIGQGFYHTATSPFLGGDTLITLMGLHQAQWSVEQFASVKQFFLSLAVFAPGTTRRKDNFIRLRAIVLDLDVHNEWRKSAAPYQTYNEAMDAIRLHLADYPPHLVVDSGYGLQVWLLIDTVETPDRVSRERANAMANAIKDSLKADKINVSGLDRFPLSIHAKGNGQPERPTQIIHAAPDAPAYCLEEMAVAFGYVEDGPAVCDAGAGECVIDFDDFPEALYHQFHSLPTELQALIKMDVSDRSDLAWTVHRQLYKLGISIENAADLIWLNTQQQKKWRNRQRLLDDVRRVYSKCRAYEASGIHGMLPLNGTLITEDDLDDEDDDL